MALTPHPAELVLIFLHGPPLVAFALYSIINRG